MLKSAVALLMCILALSGCATTPIFTLASGDVIKARTIVEETSSTYVIEEKETGRRTVIPKGAVVSVEGLDK